MNRQTDAPPATFDIFVVRHGATLANENRLYCGRSDLALCESGRSNLNKLKSCYDQVMITTCYHSGLKRTRETAEILFPGIQTQEISALSEFDFGDFELQSHEQLIQNPEYQNWINDFENIGCPNGERLPLFMERVITAWQDLLKNLDQPVAIVTHGGVISRLMDFSFPNMRLDYEWQPACGAGYRLTLAKDSDAVRVIAFNEICVEGV
ncbi:MAG: histidine phosphatase family protein [Eubacteriales bacterium]|nr:histidine phosphatase family protein [Eubacteriales bacterium]